MKKTITTLAISALLLFTTSITVSAHGHSHNTVTHSYEICTRKNCTTVDNHSHKGITYSGHYNGDGHNYHNNTSHH